MQAISKMAVAVQETVPCTGGFPEMGPPVVQSLEIHFSFKNALTAAENILHGTPHTGAGCCLCLNGSA